MSANANSPIASCRWRLRDFVACAGLLLATAAVVLWQNAHLTVLWDSSYILDSSFRISLGQLPYRDFPFAHAPLTFLIQAAIIRLAGRAFFHHVVYAAIVGGLGTVVAWRCILFILRPNLRSCWGVSLLLAVPLTFLGIYSILPFPSYDCDCAFSILIAVLLLQRVSAASEAVARKATSRAILLAFVAGAAAVVPMFFKQNIGLPFLAALLASVQLLLAGRLKSNNGRTSSNLGSLDLFTIPAGAGLALGAACLLLHFSVGLHNYIHWTIQFAAQRRLPGMGTMLSVYAEPSLLWWIPCLALGVALLRTRLSWFQWSRWVALGLLAAPFLWTLASLAIYSDADDRADSLLALWPLLLVASVALTVFNLLHDLTLRNLLPVAVLAAIHGALLSQQLWGSTYAIWPLLMILAATMISFLAASCAAVTTDGVLPGTVRIAPVFTVVFSCALLVCGALYALSEERLSYAQAMDGVVCRSKISELKGMAIRGPYLADFEELLRFAAAEIPRAEGMILIPGEDPFYFVTGRIPQFPVLLFDPATDPLSPAQLAEAARAGKTRWLIVKRNLQIKEDPTPQREAAMRELLHMFVPFRRLRAYDVYWRP